MVVSGNASEQILDSYELERRGHAEELINTALELGRQIQPIDPAQAKERDAFFAAIRQDPAAMQAFEAEMLKSIMNRSVGEGMVVAPAAEGISGRYLIQPEVTVDGGPVLLDDCLGPGFSIIGYDCDPRAHIDDELITRWQAMGASVLQMASPRGDQAAAAIIDHKDEIGAWMGDRRPVILLIRPDRFCMAAAGVKEAQVQLGRALELMTGGVQVSRHPEGAGTSVAS
jgi:3-(3-hydroxy-phenyl)propionate hydroxylase